MAIDDVFVMRAEYLAGPLTISNVFHYRHTVDNGQDRPTALLEICNQWISDWTTSAAPISSTDITLVGVEGWVYQAPTIAVAVSSGVTGSLVEELLPIRSSPVVKKNTGLRGRSYQGRFYSWPPTETQSNQGALTGAYELALNGFYNSIVTFVAGTGDTYALVVLSRVLSPLPPANPVNTLVTSVDVQGVAGSQRKRQKVTA